MKAEERLANHRAWHDDVHERCIDNEIRESFDTCADLAREAIALLRDCLQYAVHRADCKWPHGSDRCTCGRNKWAKHVARFLDGEKEGP